jgi:hypothetical protein
MPLSPRTQQLQMAGGAGADQATALFEKGFSDLAYNVLLNRLPDIADQVVTFKVLETDLDAGMGVGAFVLMRHDQPMYVPVVLADNNLKPLDLVYHKALNLFLPLSKAWLDEIDRTALAALGKGIKTPETLYSDVDIRNIVVPPLTGRFSYAAWEPVVLADVARTFARESLDKTAASSAPVLLEFLDRAPNVVKLAFVRVLERRPRLLKQAAAVYGVGALREALRPKIEKRAAKQPYGGALWIADVDTTPTEFRRIFGDQAAEAYAGVRRRGFAAKDQRLQRNLVVQEQPYERWVEPQQPGVYILTTSEGDERPAFVMPNPIDLFAEGTRYGRRPAIPGHNPIVDNSYADPGPFGLRSNRVYPVGRPDESRYATSRHGVPKYLAVLPNGNYLQSDQLVGRDSVADAVAGGPLHERMFQSVSGAPKQGLGFFVRARGTTFQATVPIEIRSITSGSNGVRRIRVSSPGGFTEKTVITEPTNPYGAIWMPKGANVVYLPPDFIWVPLKEKLSPSDFFTSSLDLAACASQKLSAAGARKVSIKNAGARQVSIDGIAAIDRVPAIKKLAFEYGLSVDDGELLVKKAEAEHQVRAWVASPQQLALVQMQLDKTAASDDSDKKPRKKAPPAQASEPGEATGPDGESGDALGTDAALAAMAGAPPEPPQPTPTDLAAMEMQQQIDLEIQKLHEKAEMLAALTQRASEIASGAPPMPTVQTQAMGAPPPSMNLATGAPQQPTIPPMLSPAMPPPEVGNPAGALALPPPAVAADPMMDGTAPGMSGDPMMAGGQDPNMGAPPPPMAMMGADGPSADALATEINPQFLEQAGRLQSTDVFDAAAVASLAQSPEVKELVGQYLPNLEKALDNLGRVLLTLWMQEPEIKTDVGESTFADLEDNLRGTFKSLGDLVLKLSQGAHALHGETEHGDA